MFQKSTALLAVAILAAPVAALAQSTYTFAYDGPPLPIFRDSANIVSIANVFVPKALTINKVTATIEIDYPRSGDLNVYMYSPALTRTKLLERNCGSTGSVVNVTFDDSASGKFSDVCPSTPGTFRGNEPLSNFNNQTALGIWSLAVENNGSDQFIGFLRGFTVAISGNLAVNKPVTTANGVFNAAGFQSATVSPGEMIDIEGFNLGPQTPVTAPAGDLPTSLGGTQVTFGGTPGAVAYASSYVLTVQVPFSVQAGKPTTMVVTYQNTTSDPITLDTLNVVPGIYTHSANGSGPVTAYNPDGSVNTLGNPAPKGQYVAITAAGLGALTPDLSTGQSPPASPAFMTVWPVTAVVDGFQANVAFAGAAPGLPGLYQINLQVPPNAASGARPITIYSQGVSSQFGTTIYVQ